MCYLYRVSHAVPSVCPTTILQRLKSLIPARPILALIVIGCYQLANVKPYRK